MNEFCIFLTKLKKGHLEKFYYGIMKMFLQAECFLGNGVKIEKAWLIY